VITAGVVVAAADKLSSWIPRIALLAMPIANASPLHNNVFHRVEILQKFMIGKLKN
jgi:hypothetical protein